MDGNRKTAHWENHRCEMLGGELGFLPTKRGGNLKGANRGQTNSMQGEKILAQKKAMKPQRVENNGGRNNPKEGKSMQGGQRLIPGEGETLNSIEIQKKGSISLTGQPSGDETAKR